MDFRRISNELIEILLGSLPAAKVLEEIARLSYDLAETILPSFAQPFEVSSNSVNLRDFIHAGGLHLDYLNGRLCSTYVERKGNRYFFDAHRFEKDRGSADVFLTFVKLTLEGTSKTENTGD